MHARNTRPRHPPNHTVLLPHRHCLQAAHVFFSSKPSVQHLAAIRECPHLVSRLRTLKEVGAA